MSERFETHLVTGEVALTGVQRALEVRAYFLRELEGLQRRAAENAQACHQEMRRLTTEVARASGVEDFDLDDGEWVLDVEYFEKHGVAFLKHRVGAARQLLDALDRGGRGDA